MEEKSNIYLDLDDDITGIIKKVEHAKEKTVNLVVPKRSSTLTSVVNLKLVKKSAAGADKKLVLITEDAKINGMAGRLGMLTAANLKVPPQVPVVAKQAIELPSDVIEDTAAPSTPTPASPASSSRGATLASRLGASAVARAKTAKSKIPDFNRFKRKTLIGIAGLIGLFLLLWVAFFVLPQATIAVQGRTEPVDVDFNLTLDTAADKPNLEQAVLPAVLHDTDKTLTGSFTPTGKKDVGTKASGNVTIKNCQTSSTKNYSAGIKFISPSGKTYLATSSFSVPGAVYNGGLTCSTSDAIAVSAASNGDSFNTSPSDNYDSPSFHGDYTISGSEMSGGTSKTITIVSSSDLGQAKKDLLDKEKEDVKRDLAERFGDDEYVIDGSFEQKVTDTNSNPDVGEEADSAQLVLKVSYKIYGVKRQNLEDLLRLKLQDKAKTLKSQLGVADTGLDQAEFKPVQKVTSKVQQFHLSTQGLLGPDLNFDQLKEQLAGKKYGEAIDRVKTYPNVTGVDIDFSPFWVRSVPHNPNKITIKLDVPGAKGQ